MGDSQFQTNIDTCHQIVQKWSNFFITPLQEAWTSPKIPYRIRGAHESLQFEEPCQEPAGRETERIFLKAGFQAWLAYFLTNRNEVNHQTLEAFHRLSADDRSKVAEKIAEIKCHETVDKLIGELKRGRKRKRGRDKGHDIEPFGYATDSTMSSLPPANRSLPSTEDAMTTSTSHTDTTTPILQPINRMGAAMTPSGTSVPNAASDPSTASMQAQQFALGSFPGLFEFFDPKFCGSVSSKDGKANVMFNFPHATSHGFKLGCLMSLAIKASEVPLLAWRLFGVFIRNGDDDIRHVVLENGGRCLSRSFQFQGPLDDDIEKALGPKIAEAIARSPVRETELSAGIAATTCVTLSFSDGPKDDGMLSLSLGLDHGLKMYEKLFR